MNNQISEQDILVIRLESYIKRGIKNEFLTIKKRNEKSKERQSLFSELDDFTVMSFFTLDQYDFLNHSFEFMNFKFFVENDPLYTALENLSETQRQVLFLKFWLEMTDESIGIILQIPKSTVGDIRRRAIKLLKQFLTL